MMESLFAAPPSAIISPCGRYRYSLTRTWDEDKPRILFCLLNPSTADAMKDDQTLRRCIGYAHRWGYGSLEIVNLFAMRATDPRDLRDVSDPVGPENDQYIREAVTRTRKVIVGWGANARSIQPGRAAEVLAIIGRCFCLSITGGGDPGHPLYLPADLAPILYMRRKGD